MNDSNTAGDNECSLHEALINANNNSDSTSGDCVAGSANDSFEFSITTGTAPYTIAVGSGLPNITDPVTIDGLTQSGADCQTGLMIVIDGSGVPAFSRLSVHADSRPGHQ